MFSISHSAHAPRYIQIRQSFNHSAPSSFSRSTAANTASVHTRCVPCGSARSPATKRLMRLHFTEQVADNFYVGFTDRILLDFTGFVEGDVQEVTTFQRNVVVSTSCVLRHGGSDLWWSGYRVYPYRRLFCLSGIYGFRRTFHWSPDLHCL